MKNKLALVLITIIPALASCSKSSSFEYTILNKHNKGVSGVEVTLGKQKGTTDKNGKVTLSGDSKANVSLDKLPSGYSWNGEVNDNTIVLDSSLINSPIERGKTISIGDIAHNYTFTCSEYVDDTDTIREYDISLKAMLETNDFICLNFFFFSCSYCHQEAPFISEAYNAYKDQGYMIAVDSVDLNKTSKDLCNFKKSESLTMDVAYDPQRMTNGYGVTSFPTTIIIDRYGFVCFRLEGAFTSANELKTVFSKFVGEDYKPVMFKANSLEEL